MLPISSQASCEEQTPERLLFLIWWGRAFLSPILAFRCGCSQKYPPPRKSEIRFLPMRKNNLFFLIVNNPREKMLLVVRKVGRLIDDIYHPASGVINIIYQPAPTPLPPTPSPQEGDFASAYGLLRQGAKAHKHWRYSWWHAFCMNAKSLPP